MTTNKRQKNTALFALLCLLLGYPILSIVNAPETIAGIPILFVYIAAVWVLGILLLFISAEVKPLRKSTKQHE